MDSSIFPFFHPSYQSITHPYRTTLTHPSNPSSALSNLDPSIQPARFSSSYLPIPPFHHPPFHSSYIHQPIPLIVHQSLLSSFHSPVSPSAIHPFLHRSIPPFPQS